MLCATAGDAAATAADTMRAGSNPLAARRVGAIAALLVSQSSKTAGHGSEAKVQFTSAQREHVTVNENGRVYCAVRPVLSGWAETLVEYTAMAGVASVVIVHDVLL